MEQVGDPGGISPGNSLGTLSGPTDPSTAGIYTYTPVLNLTLSPSTDYFIVLTAGTTVANGAYSWSYAGTSSYNPIDQWWGVGGAIPGVPGHAAEYWQSSQGSSWSVAYANIQFAINGTAVPEPCFGILLGLGGSCLLLHRRRH